MLVITAPAARLAQQYQCILMMRERCLVRVSLLSHTGDRIKSPYVYRDVAVTILKIRGGR